MMVNVDSGERRINGPIPNPADLAVVDELSRMEPISVGAAYGVVWDRASGHSVYDAHGNKWIDFTSTIFVANSGHGNPEVVANIQKVIAKPLLHSYNHPTIEKRDYLRALLDATPGYLEKAFLVSAGTEATETALKIMRVNGGNRKVVISVDGAYHGRTLGAQLMSGNQSNIEWYGQCDKKIFHIPFPTSELIESEGVPEKDFLFMCLNKIERQTGLNLKSEVCGFMLETFQGWGAMFYPKTFVQAVRRYSEDIGALLCFDEMQAGFGRTGKFFGYEHYEVNPDLVCVGKGVSSSVPLSAVLGSANYLDHPGLGMLSSTHTGNPVSCAAGLGNLNYILGNNLINRSEDLGHKMLERLECLKEQCPEIIKSVNSVGLLAGVIFNNANGVSGTDIANRICVGCLNNGLLVVKTGRESIKLAPPLTISESALLEGLSVFAEVVEAEASRLLSADKV